MRLSRRCHFSGRANKSLVLGLVLLSFLGCNRAGGDQGDKRAGEARPQAPPRSALTRPVILLTGFEPFGERKPPNPSWEGIAPLDGQPWKEYRLVCKQLRVVWAAPREELQHCISECHPIAIFSFGQGGIGSFTVESKASNKRGRIPDNRGALPPTPVIVDGGPEEFQSTLDCGALSRSLSQAGYQVRVSTRAGHYLCEETLYSLEYLKTKNKLETVSFCHVPPLGTRIGDKLVTAEYVQQFVKGVLEAWYAVYHKTNPPSPAGGPHG